MASAPPGTGRTPRGSAHFLRETVGRVRHAGATSTHQRTDSGFYTQAMVRRLPQMAEVRFSITARQTPDLSNLIEAIPEADSGRPSPGWRSGLTVYVAETDSTRPSESKPDAATVRLIGTPGQAHARLPT